MNLSRAYIAFLLLKETTGQLSPGESEELVKWKQASGATDQELLELTKLPTLQQREKDYAEACQRAEQLSLPVAIGSTFVSVHRVHFLKTAWFRYAAAVVLMLGCVSTFLYLYQKPDKKITVQLPGPRPDIQSGDKKAILTLADGSTLILDSAANGVLAQEGNTKILKLDAGSLTYEGSPSVGDLLYNTISTPPGGLYQVGLPDGSKVWLNAASSIRFPTNFGKERGVVLTGEAYFEITTDRRRPFIVKTATDIIQVLGTSLNVSAYPDETAVKTSLVNGVVRIEETVLKPGQAFIGGKIFNTDLQQDMAWRRGVFDFNKLSLPAVMKQLSRWYDVEIIYGKDLPTIQFYGEVGRDLSLQQVLNVLSDFGVTYVLEKDNRLIITRTH